MFESLDLKGILKIETKKCEFEFGSDFREPVKYSFPQMEVSMSPVLRYLYKVDIEIQIQVSFPKGLITDHKVMEQKSKRFGLLDSPKTCLKTQKLLNVNLGLISSEEPVKYSFSQLEI